MSAMIMNGNTPTLISGVPNVAESLATTRSQASASPSAPASTWPYAAHALVGARRLERVDHLVHQLVRERVAIVRGIECQPRYAVVADLVEDRVVGHAAISTTVPGRAPRPLGHQPEAERCTRQSSSVSMARPPRSEPWPARSS